MKVRATGVGLDPAPPKENEIAFQNVNFSAVAGSVTRLAAPGAFADLALRADLPPKLLLGKPFALAASVAAVPSGFMEGRAYPGGLEKLAGKLLLGTSLEGTLDVEGKKLAVAASSSFAKDAPGRELVFGATPLGAEKLEDGSARTAERMSFRAAPDAKPASLDLTLTPVPPGTLSNTPRRLVVIFKARLQVAVPVAELPKDQPPPEATLEIGGTSYALDPVDVGQLPRPEVEIEATYVRQANEGAPPRGNAPAALEPSRLTSDKPEPLAAIDAIAELAAATTDLAASSFESAEAHARRSLHANPSRADAWSALGEALLRRAKAADAVAPLLRAAALDPESGRPLVLLAEALAGSGHADEAKETARRALSKKLEGDLSERARKIAGE